MRSRWIRVLVTAAAPLAALLFATEPAHAQPAVPVYPGMEIHQNTVSCTLGYIDPVRRVAYTAGHCRGTGPVTDRSGNFIGTQLMFQDNTPDGSTVTTDHVISDWETIELAPHVVIAPALPTGRELVEDAGVAPAVGMPVCHFGMVTGESCGTIQSVNNGWFTMANGVVSQKGDSGGPVYTLTEDGRAVIVGMFNSTWGQFPAAVSWHATNEQINAEVVRATAATVDPVAPAN